MSNLNNDFLEEYKQLDKLCREIYSSEKGVTSYLDEMKSVPESEWRGIPNWNSDLRRLSTLRHLRNCLTHEVGTLNEYICMKEDVDWLKEFYNRIFILNDPLSLLRKKREAVQKKTSNIVKKKFQESGIQEEKDSLQSTDNMNGRKWKMMILGGLIVIVLVSMLAIVVGCMVIWKYFFINLCLH